MRGQTLHFLEEDTVVARPVRRAIQQDAHERGRTAEKASKKARCCGRTRAPLVRVHGSRRMRIQFSLKRGKAPRNGSVSYNSRSTLSTAAASTAYRPARSAHTVEFC